MIKYLFLLLRVSALMLFLLPVPGEGQTPSAPTSPPQREKSGFLLPQKHSQLSYSEKKGQALYDFYCAICHGATGNGDGFNSYTLATPPAKLADPKLMAKLTDAQIMDVIRKGGTVLGLSPLMPAWGNLFKAPEIKALIAYIRTFSKK